MIINHKNLLIDIEPLLKEKAYHIVQILELTREREKRINPQKYKDWQRDNDEWTHSDQVHYHSKVKIHMEKIALCHRQLTEAEESHKAKKEEMEAHDICPLWTEDQKAVDDKLHEEVQKILEAIENPELDGIKDILKKKAIHPMPGYRTCVSRSTDPAFINNTFVLPEPTLRIRVVYADNTSEPVQNGHIIHWQYCGDAIHPFPLYEKHTELMLPAGVATTDRNGFIVQGAPEQSGMEILFDPTANSLVVTHDTPASEIDKIQQAYEAADKKNDLELYTRLSDPHPATCPVDHTFKSKLATKPKDLSIDTIELEAAQVGFHESDTENFANPGFFKYNYTPFKGQAKFQKFQSRTQPPYHRILANMAYHGFSSERQKKIDDLQVFQEKESYQKPGRVNQHYFPDSNDYGFMLYPVDRGPIATKDLDTLTQAQNGRQIAKKGKIKAIAETTENGHATIALHCTLPEWDRRLNAKLRQLLYAQKALAVQLHPHDHNIKSIILLRSLFKCQGSFSQELGTEERNKHRYIEEDLGEIYDNLFKKTNDKAGRIELRVDHAVTGVEDAANDLWELLKSQALCEELAAYRQQTMPGEQSEAQTNDVLDPGPDMRAEPFWGHIFETLAKCYSALANTPIADEVFNSQIAPYFVKIANSVNDVAASTRVIAFFETLTKDAKLFVDDEDEDEQNELDPFNQRISITLNDDIADTIIPAEKDSTANNFNPLKEIPIQYLKASGAIFHATPGPPCLTESLLDSYYDHLLRMASRNAKTHQVFHIKLALGLFKAFGVISKDMVNDKKKFQLFKKSFHNFLRNHGRIGNVKEINWSLLKSELLEQIEMAQEKQALLKKELEQLEKKSGSKYRRRRRSIRKKLTGYDTNLQEMMEDAKTLFNGETKKSSSSDFHYKASGRLKYKSVMMTFHIVSVIETWGNLKNGQVQTFDEGLLLISSISEAVLDTMWKGAIGFKLSINWYDKIKSSAKPWSKKKDKIDNGPAKDGALKTAGKTTSKTVAKVEQFAEKMGTALAVVGSVSALLQSVKHFREGETTEAALKLIEASSASVVTAGHMIKASARLSATRTGAFIMRQMVKANSLFAIVTIVQIAYWMYQMTRPEALKSSREVWKAVENTKYAYWIAMRGSYNDKNQQELKKKEVPIQDFYFPPGTDPALRAAFAGMRSKLKKVTFDFMDWRAVIPLYKAGYSETFIHGTVIRALNVSARSFIDARKDRVAGVEKEIQRLQHYMNNYKLTGFEKKGYDEEMERWKQKKQYFKHRHGFRPMDANTIIEFYRYLVSEDGVAPEEGKDKTAVFDNGKTYEEVREQLEEGTFEPDKNKPELLPAQKDYRGYNFAEVDKKAKEEKVISIELIISRWHPEIAESQTYLSAAE